MNEWPVVLLLVFSDGFEEKEKEKKIDLIYSSINFSFLFRQKNLWNAS